MVASPQLGTPQAVASLLHGDSEGIPGATLVPNIIATRNVVRAAARNFESAYDLLPSPHYFDTVTDPIFVFDSAPFTQVWRDFWGSTISTYAPYVQFLTGTGVARTRPGPSLVHIPEVARSDLMDGAHSYHATYDTYPLPPTMRVVEVAGWGNETTKGVVYKNRHLVQGYDTLQTIEGDGVVVYPSALGSNQEDYYFNLSLFNKNEANDVEHGTLFNANPVLAVLQRVIKNQGMTEIPYLSNTKPPLTEDEKRLRVSTHSPVILGAYDSSGNFTGIYPNQDLSADLLYVQNQIPGSTFNVFGDNQYLSLPVGGTYTLTYRGTGTGPTTVDVEQVTNDVVTPVATYTDIPTTPQSFVRFVVDTTAPQNSNLLIDQDSDGITDTYVAPDGGTLSLDQLLVNLTTAVNSLVIKTSLKTQLLTKVATIQKKIAKQRSKQGTVLASLQAQIAKQAGKKIDVATATQISTLLDSLIAQSATIPLDPTLIDELQAEINTLPVSSLKTSLLNKVTQLQNLAAVSKSLAGFTQTIVKKGAKGAIPDADVQNILSILDSINSTL